MGKVWFCVAFKKGFKPSFTEALILAKNSSYEF